MSPVLIQAVLIQVALAAQVAAAPQVAAAAQTAAAQMPAPPAAACKRPPVDVFTSGVKVVKVVHVFTGPDGESHIEDTVMTGQSHTMANIAMPFEQTVLGPSSKVSLISGPGGVTLPTHPSPRTIYLEIAGSAFVSVPSGEERELLPGTLAIFDDPTSKIGHGGRTGPCGYVALAIAPPTSAPPPAAH